MTAETFFERWVWPAGGSGGIPGDVVATLVWVVIAGVVSAILWPPLRHRIEAFLRRHLRSEHAELHRKLDEANRRLQHVIDHHPDIPPLEAPDGDASDPAS